MSDSRTHQRFLAAVSVCPGPWRSLLAAPVTAAAQEEAIVEQIAPLIAAEDAREFQPDTLSPRPGGARTPSCAESPRMSAGRIGDLRATPLLLPAAHRSRFHRARDGRVRARAAARHRRGPALDRPPDRPSRPRARQRGRGDHGARQDRWPAVRRFFAGVLGGKVVLTQADPRARQAGDRAPVLAARQRCPRAEPPAVHGRHQPDGALARAVYALGRLRAPAAADRMLLALSGPRGVHPRRSRRAP